MSTLLAQVVEQQWLSPFDQQFAQLLVGGSSSFALLLSVSYLSAYSRQGHVCLPLIHLANGQFLAEIEPLLRQQLLQQLQQEIDAQLTVEQQLVVWQQLLLSCQAVGQADQLTPLVLQDGRLYLRRLWQSEYQVGQFIRQAGRQALAVTPQLSDYLQILFGHSPTDQADWQKVAAAVALTRRFSVISGGPGTGKTTTVAKILLALLAQKHPSAEQPLRILLAAPTGKAAMRLTESLQGQLRQLAQHYFPQQLPQWQASFPEEAQTLHRLLGITENQQARFNAKTPLHADVVIVDEASMIDVTMMDKLMQALPAQGQLILLGDKDQLASVESGSVLGDIGLLTEQGYSQARAEQLQQLTGYSLSGDRHLPVDQLGDCVALLRKSYRFTADSAIGQLTQAVYRGQAPHFWQIMQQHPSTLHDFGYQVAVDYQQRVAELAAGYLPYLQQLQQSVAISELFQQFNKFRILCALRLGPYGVAGLNQQIIAVLQQQGLLPKAALTQQWYHGRPIMITRNEPTLKLFNGDIGLVLQDKTGMRAYFISASDQLRSLPVSRLPEHQTAWAMTVHKAQGSEFDHCALVLPDYPLPLLSRELLYTAVSRAKQQFTLCAMPAVVDFMLANALQRFSGLPRYWSIVN